MIILFTTPKGDKITGKVAFCQFAQMGIATLTRRLNDTQQFEHKGEIYTYEYFTKDKTRQIKEKRSKRWSDRKRKLDEDSYKKFVLNGDFVTEFSCKTGTPVLVKTYYKDTFENILKYLLWFVCKRKK